LQIVTYLLAGGIAWRTSNEW